MFEVGQFADLWRRMAQRLGLNVDYVPGNWRRGADLRQLEARLTADVSHQTKAVMVVQNETATGVTSRIAEIRKIMDGARHPALLMVDAISSLGAIDLRHDEWGIDVTIAGSEKGLMLPPAWASTRFPKKRCAPMKTPACRGPTGTGREILKQNKAGFFPYTPPTNLLYGLREAITMLKEEGLENVFRRHQRHAQATRAAVSHWGLEVVCEAPEEYSKHVTERVD